MTPAGVAEHCRVVVATIGICRVLVIAIFSHNMVLIFAHGQIKASLAMTDPNAQSGSCQLRQHHAMVILNRYTGEVAFVFA